MTEKPFRAYFHEVGETSFADIQLKFRVNLCKWNYKISASSLKFFAFQDALVYVRVDCFIPIVTGNGTVYFKNRGASPVV